MSEHPRWPSSSWRAPRHSGSWAALGGRPVGPLVDVRGLGRGPGSTHASADWRPTGTPPRQIAASSGVSVSSVAQLPAARTCPDCGGPVPSPAPRRAHRVHRAREPTIARAWTPGRRPPAMCGSGQERGTAPPELSRMDAVTRAARGRWEAREPGGRARTWSATSTATGADPWNAELLDAGAGMRIPALERRAVRSALAAYWTRPVAAHRRGCARAQWRGPAASTLRGGATEAAAPAPGRASPPCRRRRIGSSPRSQPRTARRGRSARAARSRRCPRSGEPAGRGRLGGENAEQHVAGVQPTVAAPPRRSPAR